MNLIMAILIFLSALISCVLMVRLLRSGKGIADKIGGCVLLLIPFFGPFLFQFVIDPPSAKHPRLQARGPRGEYANRWIAIRPILENGLRQKNELQEKRRKDA